MTEGRKLDTRIERELTDAEMRLHRLLEARQQAGPEEREVLSRVIEELGREMEALRAAANAVSEMPRAGRS